MLLQALIRDRDNPQAWAVYGDWLESVGDPRALLMSVMLRREALASRAMDDALTAQAQLILSLTPESLKTLETRGHPRFAPVFRRGFLFSAGATQTSDFEALVQHPSAALLDRVFLAPEEPATLEDWLALIQSPLPWRHLELTSDAEELDLTPLGLHLPWLDSLTIDPSAAQLTFPASTTLRRVCLRAPSPDQVQALLEAELPALETVELLAPRECQPGEAPDLDPVVEVLEAWLPKLSRVVLEGAPGPTTARVVERAKHVLVRTSEAVDATFPVALQLEPEASFAVLRGPLTAEQLATLTTFGTTVGLTRLLITEGSLRLGGTELTVLRFNGAGEVPLVPRGAIQQLAKKDRALDAVAFTISVSNDVASAWSVGPHVALPEVSSKRSNVVPVSRRDESAYSRHELTRAVLGSLAGFDPGLDVLEELIGSIEVGKAHVVIGAAPARGEQLALFTEHAAVPLEEEVDEYDRDEDEEEEEEVDYDDDPEFGDQAWREQLVNVPVFAGSEVPVPVDEDDPEDDLDGPLFDAATADEEEVWTQGPVELPEHHDSLPGDRISEGEERMLNEDELCPRCHQPGETARCSQCLEEVCRSCAGLEAGAWEEEIAFCCAQCVAPVGVFVTPSPRPSPPKGRGSP